MTSPKSAPARFGRTAFVLTAALAVCPLRGTSSALANASSVFLRSYQNTAIDWQPWNEATIAHAREEQKPIYLAIGLFTNELSRTMARQSFANPEVAAFLRQNFICVLVDAKEHPALTAQYQAYLGVTKQLNGLPINVWLTPELKPIDGTTYLPPTEEWGKEGFVTATKRIAAAWKSDPATLRRRSEEVVASVLAAERAPAPKASAAEAASILHAAISAACARFDTANGGFGDPPKYPEPELLRCLLHDPANRQLALATLRAIVASPLHDPLDGGFFRYAQDPEWRQPCLQKHLADQARIALALLDGAQVSGDTSLADAAVDALHYVLDRLRDPQDGFANAEDATPETLAGACFWTKAEVVESLGADAPAFCIAYGVTPVGNVPADAYPGLAATGKNLLFRGTPRGSAAAELQLAADCAKLLARRASRPAPLRDAAAPAAAHGLLLAAFVRAGSEARDSRCTEAAHTEFAFIRDRLCRPDGSLRRLADQPFVATPADYVAVIQGLWTLRGLGETATESLATTLTHTLQSRFWDNATGRYFAASNATELGLWARLHLPQPVAGDLPLAEAAMLASGAKHPLPAGLSAQLVSTIAVQLNEAGDDRRGDFMLALQCALQPE